MILRTALTFAISCILVLIFFVWTFPYQALEKRLEHEFARITGQPTELEGLNYAFPLGIRCASAHISFPSGSKVPELNLNHPGLVFSPAGLLSRQLRGNFDFGILDGRVHGRAGFSSLFNLNSFELDCTGQDLDIDALNIPDMLRTVETAQGLISFALHLAGPMRNGPKPTGDGEFHLTDGSLQFSIPGDSLPFTDIRGQGTWEVREHEIHLAQGQVKAKGAEAELSGNIDLRSSLADSDLDLTGQIQLSGANPKAYSLARKYLGGSQIGFALTGSLRDPRYSLQ
jgi:type II secretion system protein N